VTFPGFLDWFSSFWMVGTQVFWFFALFFEEKWLSPLSFPFPNPLLGMFGGFPVVWA
jgi:hypothetical protein